MEFHESLDFIVGGVAMADRADDGEVSCPRCDD